MTEYKTIAQARKSLVVQVIILTALIVVICMVARLKTGNRFNTLLLLSSREANVKASDLVLTWKKDAIPIKDYSVGVEREGDLDVTFMYLNMMPDGPGEYELSVLDKNGIEVANDTFHVGRFMTVFSEKTGNFTGDEDLFLAILVIIFSLFTWLSMI